MRPVPQKNNEATKPSIVSVSELSIWILLLGFVVLFFVGIGGGLKTVWSFDLLRYSGVKAALPGLIVVLMALGLRLCLPFLQRIHLPQLTFRVTLTICLSVGIVIIYALTRYKIPHYFLGDGNLIGSLIAPNSSYPLAIGDQGIQWLITVVGRLSNWDSEIAFRTLSITGGLFFLCSSAYLITRLTKGGWNAVLLFLLLCSQPYMLFFSDYIETYPLLLGLFAFYFFLTATMGNSTRDNIVLTLLGFLLFLLHPLFVVFFFAHICRFLLFKYKNKFVLIGFTATALFGAVFYIVTSDVMNSLPVLSYFLTVGDSPSHVYTFFSPGHFSDIAKWFSFSIFPICLAPLALNFQKEKLPFAAKVLLPYAISAIIMQCLVDSALGAFDWDTFCTFAIPFTLMCAVAITRAADFNSLRYSCILLALIGASLVRLVPWFTLNANLEKASDYAINVAKYDPHQQLDTRKYSLSTRLRDVGLKDKAFAIAKELNEKDGKSNAVPKNNYAMNLVDAGRYDEALVVYREIVGKYPGYYNANANLGELYVEHYDQNDSARKYLDRALSIRPDASDVLYALAFVEIKAGRFNEAREKLLRTIASNPLHADAHAKLGMVDVQLGNINEGVMHLDKAVELGGIPTPTLMWICQTYQKLGLPAKEKICRDAMAKVK